MHPCTHRRSRGLVVRAFLRDAASCDVILTGETPPEAFPMKLLAPEGLFEVFIPKRQEVCAYELRAVSADGRSRQFRDPYCFLPTLGDQDLYLFNEGNEHRIYDKLGAHQRDLGGTTGTAFAVWAPSASRVSVVGDFNGWDGRYHPMRSLGASGVWEIFIPGIGEGALYKFEIATSRAASASRPTPTGRASRGPPATPRSPARRAASPGGTPRGSSGAAVRRASRTTRSPSTRCTSAPGGGNPRRGTGRSPTGRRRRSSPTTP
jgi:1,4-alpha-glucan branching enzyme